MKRHVRFKRKTRAFWADSAKRLVIGLSEGPFS